MIAELACCICGAEFTLYYHQGDRGEVIVEKTEQACLCELTGEDIAAIVEDFEYNSNTVDDHGEEGL